MAKVMGSVARWTLMLALVASAFLYTLKAREETYDRFPGPGDGLWRTLNSNSLVFTRNWFLMGPAADNFLPNFNAYSIEKRLPPIFYVSYPPFFVFIPWAFSVVSGELPSLKLLMHLSLGAQAVTALLLLGFAYSLLC